MLYHEVRHFSYRCVWKIIEHCNKIKTDDRPGQTPKHKLAQKLALKQKKSDAAERVDPAHLVTRLHGVTSKASP